MRAFALLAVLFCACSPRIAVYVGEGERDELVTATADAVDAWNARLGVPVLDLVVTDSPRAAYADLGAVHVTTTDKPRCGDNACTVHVGALNRIAVRAGALDDMEAPTLDWLLDHEMGHVLGLTHVEGTPNVMNADPWFGEESSATTAKQRRRARAVAGLEALAL